MRNRILISMLLLIALSSIPAGADSVTDAITLAADGLRSSQITTGPSAGSWNGEDLYTGTIITGLIHAYQMNGNPAYLPAAELGGDYIIANGGFYGDETYALCKLSEISADPYWLFVVDDFYDWIKTFEGTQSYIDGFQNTNPSTAVFYMAHHTLAAYYVNAADKALYRQGLMKFLSMVDDSTADYPVLSLAVATWALAQTGPLDNTLVKQTVGGSSIWNTVKMADLPDMLASHQSTSGPNTGSFYWRFDHAGGDGYTEEIAYAVLALNVVQDADPGLDYSTQISTARLLLAFAVYTDGKVYENIQGTGIAKRYYAGELLQALASVVLVGDLDDSGCVNAADLTNFLQHWLEQGCVYPTWGGGADLNHDGSVNLKDFALLNNSWLQCN